MAFGAAAMSSNALEAKVATAFGAAMRGSSLRTRPRRRIAIEEDVTSLIEIINITNRKNSYLFHPRPAARRPPPPLPVPDFQPADSCLLSCCEGEAGILRAFEGGVGGGEHKILTMFARRSPPPPPRSPASRATFARPFFPRLVSLPACSSTGRARKGGSGIKLI